MQPKLRLSRVREIGWSTWDPISLLSPGDAWGDQSFADEYDMYLIQAAGMLRSNTSTHDVVEYLVRIEAEHIGLGISSDTRDRAAAVVAAMQADDKLWGSEGDGGHAH